jgi:hypothetical protein
MSFGRDISNGIAAQIGSAIIGLFVVGIAVGAGLAGLVYWLIFYASNNQFNIVVGFGGGIVAMCAGLIIAKKIADA